MAPIDEQSLMFDNEERKPGCPPGRYTAKIIKDLGNEWLYEVTNGPYSGARFSLPKPMVSFPKRDGIPYSSMTGQPIH